MRKLVLLRSHLPAILWAVVGAVVLSGQQPSFNTVKPSVVKNLLEGKRKVEFVPGEIIVKKKVTAGITSEVPAQPLTQLGIESTGRLTSGGEEIYHLTTQLLTTLSAQDVKDRTVAAAKALQSRPEVEYAQPNFILHIVNTTPNDPRFSGQWHYLNRGTGAGNSPGGIGLPTVWDTNTGSSSVVVAVVDTGILSHHEDIEGSPNYGGGYDMIGDSARANANHGRDPDPTDTGDAVAADECGLGTPAQPSSWHGTHVAGTIGVGRTNNNLGVAGINWNVKVLAVRVLGKCGGTIVDINDGIRWAAGLPVAGVPNNPTPAKVINMSLGGPSPCSASPATQSAINDAVAAGAAVVVAAGNDAQDAAGSFPASCDNVIAVAASDARGFLVQRYSNFGSTVKIMAPGGDVDRTDSGTGQPDGVLSMVQGGYAYYNGTSMAAPHVSGVVALMLAQDPSLTPAQILTRLTTTAIPRSATECPKPCGAGLLNAPGAVLKGPLLTVNPASMQLSKGKTGHITAILMQNGQAQSGQTITFASDNATIASLSSSTAVTDGNGQAAISATGNSAGQTTVHAQTATMSAQASVSVAVKTPDLSQWALVLAALLLLGVFYREARKLKKGVQPR